MDKPLTSFTPTEKTSNYQAFGESPSFLFWVEQRLTGYLLFLHYQAQKERRPARSLLDC
jgi:hypothetical protein